MPTVMLPLLVGLVGLAVAAFITGEDLAVTNAGVFRGVQVRTPENDTYLAFFGIKYGTAGKFQAAEPAKYSIGVNDASEECEVCLQPRMPVGEAILRGVLDNGPIGADDCLCLNVYSPLPRKDLLPVMVFIHGGGWIVGSGNFDKYRPDFFMKTGAVVMVAISYRLHILGFGDFKNSSFPLNLGLKDQALALDWVRNNIAAFGGNPLQITLAGWSVGAASAVIHSRLPTNKGVYQGVIAQSGSPNAAWAVAPRWRSRAATIGVGRNVPACASKAMAYDKDPDVGGDLALCLSSVSNQAIIRAVLAMKTALGLVPVVEEGEDSLIKEYPWNEDMYSVTTPILTGTNAGETVRGIPAFELMNNPVSWLAVTFALRPALEVFLLFGDTSTKTSKVASAIISKYTCSMTTSRICIQQASQDYLFDYPRFMLAEQQNGIPTYVYFNEYITYADRKNREQVTGHGGELPLLFPREVLEDGTDIVMSRRLVSYWVNFVEKGYPGDEWKSYDPLSPSGMLHINKDGTIRMGPDVKVRSGLVPKFWEQLPIRDRTEP